VAKLQWSSFHQDHPTSDKLKLDYALGCAKFVRMVIAADMIEDDKANQATGFLLKNAERKSSYELLHGFYELLRGVTYEPIETEASKRFSQDQLENLRVLEGRMSAFMDMSGPAGNATRKWIAMAKWVVNDARSGPHDNK